jgi:hypothetical protein
MAVKILIMVVWFVALWSLTGGYQNLEDGGSKFLQSVGDHLQDYTVSQTQKTTINSLIIVSESV